MRLHIIQPVAIALVLAAFAIRPAAAEEPQKVTIAFAGKGMSFLLQYIVQASGGVSLEVNLALARNNVRVAADVATAYAARRD